MSIKFTFKNIAEKARKEGDSFVRFSGTGEPFNRDCERSSREIAVDTQGNPTKWRFLTGLDERLVEYYEWFTDEEKKLVLETIKDLKPQIELHYGGAEVLDSENYAFWKRRRDVNKINIDHDSAQKIRDTKNPEDALLYLSILAGAFSDVIAPNRDWAERYQIPLYLALETDDNGGMADDDDITRSDAHGLLTEIRREFGKEALLIMAWVLQYETTGFGAYSYATSEKDLVSYHIKYIDGKLGSKRKRNFPKSFLEVAEKWKGSQTRAQLFVEAYVKAGEWYNFINQREKKYVTADGTILGNTISDAVSALMKSKFKVDLENLRTLVEAKWKE